MSLVNKMGVGIVCSWVVGVITYTICTNPMIGWPVAAIVVLLVGVAMVFE
jgi:hypothetical protein